MKFTESIIKCLTIVVTAVCFWACSSDEPAPVPEPEPEPGVDVTPSRTVMVYMIADNSLGRSDCDKSDLDEMQIAVDAGALGDNGRLIVYHNRVGTSKGNPPVMIEITPGNRTTLKTYPDDPTIYSTDAARFTEVLDDMKHFAPADQYGLVLWSHGTGWIETDGSRSAAIAPGEQPMVYTFGDDRSQKMKVTTLAGVLEGHDIGFIYFDCCHMASIEVVYELRHCAPVIVGSGTELPAPGMNYTVNVPYFFAEGEADMIGAAKATFDHYNNLHGAERTCTMTVVSTAELDELARVSREIMEQGPVNGKEFAAYQSYMRRAETCYGTLYDMADYFESFEGVDPDALARWRAAFDAAVVYKAATPSVFNVVTLNRYDGLGCYIIGNGNSADYMGYTNQSWWRDVVSHNPNFKN